MAKSILVTGGAGYIGSHVVKLLGQQGEKIVVLDDLSTGFAESVLFGELVVGETGDMGLVDRVMSEHNIDTVMHFAAHTIVPESVKNPLKYYNNNTASTRNLLECCQANDVKNFIFSSTAATYGNGDGKPCKEDSPTSPINPYGMSKLMSEYMLEDLGKVCEMKYVILRYFNVAGCDPDGEIGHSTVGATLLFKVAAEVAVGKRTEMYVYGTDYPTEDGTCVRDFIHVADLASAHIHALEYLRKGGDSTRLNCGYGHGYSVRDVLNMVQEVHGSEIQISEHPRRVGDPPELIANVDKIHRTLDWQPQYDDLETIASTAINWEKLVLKKLNSV